VKNQYFGDVNDYRKYGLLRAIQSVASLDLLVAWMLTPDDGSWDGGKTAYLSRPERWRHFDPDLFDGLRTAIAPGSPRGVASAEAASLIPGARFFAQAVPDARDSRAAWGRSLFDASDGADLVFLDPDNGIEIGSKPLGHRDSSKYVYWNEIVSTWRGGASLLIYQHFPRRPRDQFVAESVAKLRARTSPALVSALRTSHVLFLLAAQLHHADALGSAVVAVKDRWEGQIF
jgi:hypothetical protein